MIKETLDNAEKVLERLLKTSSWEVSDDTELSATTIIAQALEETATQKLKEGMERALEAVEKMDEQYPIQAWNKCRETAIAAIREEIEKLTPK